MSCYIGSLEKAQLGGSKSDYFKIITNAVDRSLDIYIKSIKGDIENQDNKSALLKIGELCKEVGENSSTIRHWTQEGILEVSDITESGYQLYSRYMIDRIKYINLLKEQRFTLKEIKKKLLNNASI